MALDDLARVLSDKKRLGLDDELCDKLRITDAQVTRARLEAEANERAHVSIHLVGVWVEDCRDAIGKGEVYWWSIPMLGQGDGKIRWSPLVGLPTGVPPTSVGSKKWLPGISLKDPPLLAVAPPDDEVAACIVRIGFYEDDWAPAELGSALKVGMEALAEAKLPVADIDAFVKPIRTPLWEALKAKQDDFMLERDAKFLREEGQGFGAGSITSMLTEYVRVYLFAKDTERTEQCGPFELIKGQEQRILFPSSLEGGGQLAVFARGKVQVDPFGALDVDKPFVDTTIESRHEAGLAKGFTVTAEEKAEVVAWYTPPR